MNRLFGIIVTASMATAAPWLVAPAGAAPISSLTGLQNTLTPSVETVQYRHGGYRGRRIGGIGLGLGLGAGALLGGAILGAPGSYGRYGYGAYDPGYYDQGYTAASPYVGGDEAAYCQQRFRSYDPASGTYLGFDGLRHPCP
jgi:hypothetical protein